MPDGQPCKMRQASTGGCQKPTPCMREPWGGLLARFPAYRDEWSIVPAACMGCRGPLVQIQSPRPGTIVRLDTPPSHPRGWPFGFPQGSYCGVSNRLMKNRVCRGAKPLCRESRAPLGYFQKIPPSWPKGGSGMVERLFQDLLGNC